MNDDPLYEKTPTIFQMIKNFSKDVILYIKSGQQNVTVEDYKDRLNTCKQCPYLNEEKMRCKLCGCLLEHKAKWKTTTCPDNPKRWKPQIIDDKK